MRAVIDTNIFLSGLLNADGGAAKIIRAFQDGEFELIVTYEVFDEYVGVIHLFNNDLPAHKSEELLELVFAKAVKVRPAAAQGLCTDADDEKFLGSLRRSCGIHRDEEQEALLERCCIGQDR